jgi:hypothetical protein
MTPSDDWKGEGIIRNVPRTPLNQKNPAAKGTTGIQCKTANCSVLINATHFREGRRYCHHCARKRAKGELP